jgi:hypothetical protein
VGTPLAAQKLRSVAAGQQSEAPKPKSRVDFFESDANWAKFTAELKLWEGTRFCEQASGGRYRRGVQSDCVGLVAGLMLATGACDPWQWPTYATRSAGPQNMGIMLDMLSDHVSGCDLVWRAPEEMLLKRMEFARLKNQIKRGEYHKVKDYINRLQIPFDEIKRGRVLVGSHVQNWHHMGVVVDRANMVHLTYQSGLHLTNWHQPSILTGLRAIYVCTGKTK